MIEQDTEAAQATEEAFATLLSQAEPRQRPPREHDDAVRRSVHEAWRFAIRRRVRRQRLILSAAASVLVVLSVVFLGPEPQAPGPAYAAVLEKQFGTVDMPAGLAANGRLAAGDSLSTGPGAGVALSWVNGGSLRLDANTRVTIDSVHAIHLQRGRLYFDSNPALASGAAAAMTGALSVRTREGIVTPLGTRYLAAIDDEQLTVMVREGEVVIEHAEHAASASAGQRFVLTARGRSTTDSIALYGGDWAWIEGTTPAIDAEGKTVFEFLTWVSRESGRSLRFLSADAESLAMSAVLLGYGTIATAPSNALPLVLLATDLDWRIDQGDILISLKPERGADNRI